MRLGWAGVASLMVRFLGVSCYSGQWIFGLSLFPGLALGFFSFGCHYGALGVRLGFWILFSGCFELRVMGDGEAGSFCQGLRLLGSGAGALVISDYK